jgi:1-acyl-sn-glycerol-3-phosphate acyltransferase
MHTHWLYWMVRTTARSTLPWLGQVQVLHLDRLPPTGGVLLLPNHQSALDPFLVQGWSPRSVRSMTKSTQFGSRAMRWVLPRLGAFPVRRYRTDSQTVRSALCFLTQGEVICIYPEGERSWDGRVGPFRHGTLRLAAWAIAEGVPVLPVRISGMFDAFPRWGRPQRISHPLGLEFCPPLNDGLTIDRTRSARDRALPAVEARLREALSTE